MSRGPGRIERAIEEAFVSNSSKTFSVEELCLVAYPGINRLEKKHRVATLRAAHKPARRLGWSGRRAERPGGEIVFFNLTDVRSYTLGKLRCTAAETSLSKLEERIDDPNVYLSEWKNVQPGGCWYRHVEIHKAELRGDEFESARLRKELNEFVMRSER